MVDSLWDRLCVQENTHKQKAEHPLFLVDLCLSRVCPPPHKDATTETTCVPSMTQQD